MAPRQKNRHTRVKRYRSSSLGSSNRHRKILRAVYLKLNGVKQKPQAPADLGLLFRPEKRYIAGPVSNDVRKVLETPQAERMREAGYSDQQIINYYLD